MFHVLTAHILAFSDLVGQEVRPVDKLTASDNLLVHAVVGYFFVLDSQHVQLLVLLLSHLL